MKLSEQYEAFVKFSNDQLQKRFDAGAVPSCKCEIRLTRDSCNLLALFERGLLFLF